MGRFSAAIVRGGDGRVAYVVPPPSRVGRSQRTRVPWASRSRRWRDGGLRDDFGFGVPQAASQAESNAAVKLPHGPLSSLASTGSRGHRLAPNKPIIPFREWTLISWTSHQATV